jgi:hypothetical protein
MLLHGSEGGSAGWSHCLAILLAVQGFLAYPKSYSVGGNSWHAGDIVRVPIDQTAASLQRLRNLPIAGPYVGLYGVSRGAEHALLLALLMSPKGSGVRPDAIAVHAGTDMVHGPFRSDRMLPRRENHVISAACVQHPVTAAAADDTARTWQNSTVGLTPGEAIAIECFIGPVFLSHGTADEIWSSAMTERVAARLARARRPHELHLYRGEAHRFGADAANHHRGALVAFLKRHLLPST